MANTTKKAAKPAAPAKKAAEAPSKVKNDGLREWSVVATTEDSVTRRLPVEGGWLYRVDRLTPENLAGKENLVVNRFAGFCVVFVPSR